MVDTEAVRLAIRNRLLSLQVCTTGSVSMSVASGKFVRTTGSFVTDGFAVGMEVVPSGFSGSGNNAVAVIRSRTALEMTVDRTLTTEGSASGKSLVVGLPRVRVLENSEATDNNAPILDSNLDPLGPPVGRPYFREAFEITRFDLYTMASGGRVIDRGLYHAHVYSLENTGTQAADRISDDVKALFVPGTGLVAGSQSVRITGDPGTSVSPLQPLGNGWAHRVVTIPWRVESRNTIAA